MSRVKRLSAPVKLNRIVGPDNGRLGSDAFYRRLLIKIIKRPRCPCVLLLFGQRQGLKVCTACTVVHVRKEITCAGLNILRHVIEKAINLLTVCGV